MLINFANPNTREFYTGFKGQKNIEQ